MKKGALNLSINAIVVLILAITILGLGLGFIRNQFATATDQFDRVNEETETELINEMIQSNEQVTLKQKEFKVEMGSPYEFFYGIRNTDDDTRVYYVQFLCNQGRSEGLCDPNNEGDYYGSPSPENTWNWWKTYHRLEIPAGEGEAFYAELLADDPDTFEGEMIVWKCTDDVSNCADEASVDTGFFQPGGSAPDTDPNLYKEVAKKSFTLIVN
ncbi:MAG: hypothetical protein ACQESG_01925 [Nanobdellota archaeon]